jgi:dihydroorotate dehydrogenase (fumarate)
MHDLTTSYLGLRLRNPLIAGAGPLSRKRETVEELEAAGVGAVTVYSLFQEQIENESAAFDHYRGRASHMHPETASYFPDLGNYLLEPDQYLAHLREIRKSVKVPVFGSLNGTSRGGWTEWARKLEQTGIDALELNVYAVQTDLAVSATEVESATLELVHEVCSQVRIPVAVKLSPFYTSLPHFVVKLGEAGAKGVVLFNRFLQPDLDVENMTVNSTARLSDSSDLGLPLRWTAILSGMVQPQICLSGGVHGGKDLLKALLAGARTVQVASELIQHGPERVGVVLKELLAWMTTGEYDSLDQLRGSMGQSKVKEPAAFERAHYMKALVSLDDKFI